MTLGRYLTRFKIFVVLVSQGLSFWITLTIALWGEKTLFGKLAVLLRRLKLICTKHLVLCDIQRSTVNTPYGC